jgi:hypothetical protein
MLWCVLIVVAAVFVAWITFTTINATTRDTYYRMTDVEDESVFEALRYPKPVTLLSTPKEAARFEHEDSSPWVMLRVAGACPGCGRRKKTCRKCARVRKRFVALSQRVGGVRFAIKSVDELQCPNFRTSEGVDLKSSRKLKRLLRSVA